ncbi:MAG: hypothetical protein Q9168_003027 [Polycauliona sp. 1 TL-2023]
MPFCIALLLIASEAEPWWVNSIARQPTILPYTHGLRCLDKIYLDTTFAVNSEPYHSFPTKAHGLSDLLREVSKFPGDTVFHFNAWTLGYEEVWMALAAHLRSQIHVDDYKWRLYKSLSLLGGSASESIEGAALCGYQFGNRTQAGCLTQDESVRLHSCERGTKCSLVETSKNIVWITPLINRSDQGDIPELGAGGGGGDLTQTHELEMSDPQTVLKLIELCRQHIQDDKKLMQTLRLLEEVLFSDRKTVSLDLLDTSLEQSDIPLEDLAQLLTEVAGRKNCRQNESSYAVQSSNALSPAVEENITKTIKFPYSRHSSYTELCHLLSVFRPKDVYPCVTDEENWAPDISIETLFGHLCSGTEFSHDQEMRLVVRDNGTMNPLPTSSPRRSSRERGESSTPKPSQGGGPGLNSSPLLGETAVAASHLTPAIGEVLGEDLSPVLPNKRRGSAKVTTSRTPGANSEKLSRRSERQDRGGIAHSFSGWLDPQASVSKHIKRSMSETTDGEDVNMTIKKERNISPRTTSPGSKAEKLNTLSMDRAGQVQGRSKLSEKDHHRSAQESDTHSRLDSGNGTITRKRNPANTATGTQYDPVALSDTSASEMATTEDDDSETELHRSITEPYDSESRNSSPISMTDSTFDPQDTSRSALRTTVERTDPRRIEYRKEIYRAVKRDDGFIWGMEYSLVSTKGSYDMDDMEL